MLKTDKVIKLINASIIYIVGCDFTVIAWAITISDCNNNNVTRTLRALLASVVNGLSRTVIHFHIVETILAKITWL